MGRPFRKFLLQCSNGLSCFAIYATLHHYLCGPYYSIERIGFLTITFPKTVITPKEASRRFNSFRTHFLCDYVKTYIKVTEPHKDKRPHYHLLIVLPTDIRTGFDWEAFRASKLEYMENGRSSEFLKLSRQYSQSAAPFLRRFWSSLRKAAKAHKLGRTEILPIHSEAEAAVRYVGKYIEKGVVHRTGAWRGVRLVSCARSLERAASCRFAWVKSGARWREFVSQVAARLQIDDFEGFSSQFGSSWAFKLMQCSSHGMSADETAHIMNASRKW